MISDRKIYFDNNATTSVLPEVKETIIEILSAGALNPSSSHSSGGAARKILSESRHHISQTLCVPSSLIIFTSGGTESNNLALNTVISNNYSRVKRIVTTQVEHLSVLNKCESLKCLEIEVVCLAVNSEGLIDLEQLYEAIRDGNTLVSIQWVNNETGVIQPLYDIAKICASRSCLLHTDAAQAFGKMEINLQDIEINMLSFTGHKFHAPSGIGGIYVSEPNKFKPILFGGEQEQGLRAGTENILGIAGLGKAAEIRISRLKAVIEHMQNLRDEFERLLFEKIDGLTINGSTRHRICNTTNILFDGIDGQALLGHLNASGVLCSQGSACTSMLPRPSHVLLAMGLTEDKAYSSLRFSFSELNTLAEVHIAVDIIVESCKALRKLSRI